MDILSFIGLGIDSGQKIFGPSLAHRTFHEQKYRYLNDLNINFHDSVVQKSGDFVRIHCAEDLLKIDWSPFREAYTKINQLLDNKKIHINWGGDHSVAISTVSAFLGTFKEGHVIWIDAHADLNLPQYSPSGNLHGMPLALLLNLENIGELYFPWIKNFLTPDKLTYIGLRDIDPFEELTIKKLGIRYFSTKTIQQKGVEKLVNELGPIIGASPLHVSFDIDSVAPEYAPATGVLVPDGLKPDELYDLAKEFGRLFDVKSIDIVEINPFIGSSIEVLKTNEVASLFMFQLLSSSLKQKGVIYDQHGKHN